MQNRQSYGNSRQTRVPLERDFGDTFFIHNGNRSGKQEKNQRENAEDYCQRLAEDLVISD